MSTNSYASKTLSGYTRGTCASSTTTCCGSTSHNKITSSATKSTTTNTLTIWCTRGISNINIITIHIPGSSICTRIRNNSSSHISILINSTINKCKLSCNIWGTINITASSIFFYLNTLISTTTRRPVTILCSSRKSYTVR